MTFDEHRLTPRSIDPERSKPRFDAVSLLTIFIVLLYGISARQVVPGFGAIGTPAMLLAMTTPLVWAAGWVLPDAGLERGRHPMRPVILLLLCYQVLSFAVAMSRPVTELERTGSLRALLVSFAMAGVALLAADGIKRDKRLDTLLRRLAGAVTFISVMAAVQFFFRVPLQFRIPGLTWLRDSIGGLGGGRGVTRVMGTTLHPIELSVVAGALLPLVLHFALYSETPRQRRNFSVAAAFVALAMAMSVSRSGLVALVVSMAVLMLGWSWRRRFNAAMISLAAIPVVWATIPGLVGTLVGLFTGTDSDPSVQARINRAPRVMSHIRERPWLGLGNGTWSVEDYFLIDNEVFVTTLEMGLLGMILVTGVIITGLVTSLAVRHLPGTSEAESHRAQAVTASIAGLAISILTFDAFHYRILTGTLFMLFGVAGALWRMSATSEHFVRGLQRQSTTKIPN